MRHLRFAAFLALFILLPLGLALRGYELYADFESQGAHDEVFARQGRLLRSLKDEITLDLDKRRVAADFHHALEALPVLDVAGFDVVADSFEARLPGLLNVVVYRREFRPGRPLASLVPLRPDRIRKRTLYQGFAEYLYGSCFFQAADVARMAGRTAEADLLAPEILPEPGKGLQQMISQTITGRRLSLAFVLQARGDIVNLSTENRETALYWDLVRGGAGAPGPVRGMALLFLDEEHYRRLFDLKTLAARKEREADDPALHIGFVSRTDDVALAPFLADVPELAKRLAGTFTMPLELTGRDRLYTFLPARESDRLFVFATTDRSILDATRIRFAARLRLFLALLGLAASILGTLVHSRRIRLFISVRYQLAALFALASLLPFTVIFYMGLHYVRASEEIAARRTLESLRTRLLMVDEDGKRHRDELRDTSCRLLDDPATLRLTEALGRCASLTSAETRLSTTREIEAFEAIVRPERGPAKIYSYYVFNRTGEAILSFRLDKSVDFKTTSPRAADLIKSQRLGYYDETNFLGGIARAAIRNFEGSVQPEERESAAPVNDSIAEFFIRNQLGLADRMLKVRRAIHTLDTFGNRFDMFFEPMVDGKGKVRGLLGFFFIAPLIHLYRIDAVVRESLDHPVDGVRLYAGHVKQRSNRLPSADVFEGELSAAFEKVATERTPVEIQRTRVGGEEVLLAAVPLVELADYVILATAPYALVREEVARNLRLFTVLLALSVLFAAAIGLVIAVKFIAPVNTFQRGVAAITEGDFNFRMAIDTDDELGTLSATFNRMIGGLQEKERMSRYVSDSVKHEVKRAAAGDDALGEQRKATVLFTDIRDFTTLSETHLPSDIVSMLNDYLEVMTAVVMRHGGIVDKFIGDAIMAVFYPEPGARSDEARAVGCALEIRSQLAEFNARRRAAGLFEIDNGVGINTGDVIKGNIGSREYRIDLTVIGDNVNLASRLESLSKEGRHTKIILSEATFEAVRDLVEAERLGDRTVKGKTKTVVLYEVIGMKRIGDYLPRLASADPGTRAEGLRLLAVLGDPAALPAYVEAVADPDARVRKEALFALRRYGTGHGEAATAIRAALARESDEGTRATAVAVLGEIGSDDDRLALEPFLADENPRIRANAVEAVCRTTDRDRLIRLFRALVDDPHNRVRANAAVMLWTLGRLDALDRLVEMTRERDPLPRASGAWGLGEIATKEKVARMRASADFSGSIPETLYAALERALDALHWLLADADPMVARNAAQALGKVGSRRSSVELIRAFNRSRDDEVRQAILAALDAIGGASLLREFGA